MADFLRRSLLGQLLGMEAPEQELSAINQVPLQELTRQKQMADESGNQDRSAAIMQMLLQREQPTEPVKTSAEAPTAPPTDAPEETYWNKTLRKMGVVDPLGPLKTHGYQ